MRERDTEKKKETDCTYSRGTWVAQSVKHMTLARVMISQFVGSSPTSGSVLIAQSLEPASDSMSPSLSAPTPLTLCLTLFLKNKCKKIIKKIKCPLRKEIKKKNGKCFTMGEP